jgi:hypothetical protein
MIKYWNANVCVTFIYEELTKWIYTNITCRASLMWHKNTLITYIYITGMGRWVFVNHLCLRTSWKNCFGHLVVLHEQCSPPVDNAEVAVSVHKMRQLIDSPHSTTLSLLSVPCPGREEAHGAWRQWPLCLLRCKAHILTTWIRGHQRDRKGGGSYEAGSVGRPRHTVYTTVCSQVARRGSGQVCPPSCPRPASFSTAAKRDLCVARGYYDGSVESVVLLWWCSP